MHRTVVADIFGRTPALDKFCKALRCEVAMIDPYAGESMGFKTEQQAYEFFKGNVGLSTYSRIVRSQLAGAPTPTGLVGFSVGASAIWQISGSLNTGQVERVVCFYGSQVRSMIEIEPSVVVEHVLPRHEPGFSIAELANRLSGKENVVLYTTPYLHGFMNQLSKNYSSLGYSSHIDWLRDSGSWPANQPTRRNVE